ncbi:MAG: hypothetical protein QM811_06550 [Pirellulales bacterium]
MLELTAGRRDEDPRRGAALRQAMQPPRVLERTVVLKDVMLEGE